jgi:alkylhydroperoxidase family enzyme
LVDLTLIIAVINAWNRIAISFRANPPKRSTKSDN